MPELRQNADPVPKTETEKVLLPGMPDGMGDCADEIDFASLESSLARAVRGVVDIVRETVRADAQKGGAE